MGKGLFCQMNLTTFKGPWSYKWVQGLIFGEGINTRHAVKMPNSHIFLYLCMLERDTISEYCHVLKWIFSEYYAYKVFEVYYMTAKLLDFLTEKVKV